MDHTSYGKWISVEEALPEIPEGDYGISVIVAEFDSVFKELSGSGYDIYYATYGHTKDHTLFGHTALEKDFMTLYIGGEMGSEFGPTGSIVTHWMYLPLPPQD